MSQRKRTLADTLRDVHVTPVMRDHLARAVYNLGGGRMPFVWSAGALGNANAATETVIFTTPPLNPSLDSSLILLIGMFSTNSVGAAATQIALNIRQGTTVTGTLIGNGVKLACTPGSAFGLTIAQVDTLGAVAGMQYSLTANAVSATATTITNGGILIAMAIA